MRLMAGPRQAERAGACWSTARTSPAPMCASDRSPWSTSSSSTTRRSPSTRTSPRRCASPACRGRDRARGRGSGPAPQARASCSSARRSSSPAASSSAPRSPAPSSSGADLVLLDEPLANLDYKLREELREELPQDLRGLRRRLRLCDDRAARGAAARRQHGDAVRRAASPSSAARRRSTAAPHDLVTAQVFSDPPMNVVADREAGERVALPTGASVAATGVWRSSPTAATRSASAPHHLVAASRRRSRIRPAGTVAVTEITGSESFVHRRSRRPCAPSPSPPASIGSSRAPRRRPLSIRARLFVFAADGRLAAAAALRPAA